MKSLITLPAHYDGSTIVLDVPHELKVNEKLLVTVLESRIDDEEEKNWSKLSLSRLESAYGENEPEYSISLVREPNPDYTK